MKKIVKENIEFKRGQSVPRALGVGIQDIANRMSWVEVGCMLAMLQDGGDVEYWVDEGADRDTCREYAELFANHIEISDESLNPYANLSHLISSIKQNRGNKKYVYSDINDEDEIVPFYTNIRFPILDAHANLEKQHPEINEQIEFTRGRGTTRTMKIGKYVPGTLKEFDDVEIGDTAYDYNGEEFEVIDKMKEVGINSAALNNFLKKYDSTGIYSDLQATDDDFNVNVIAVEDPDRRGTYVFDYGYDGAFVEWE